MKTPWGQTGSAVTAPDTAPDMVTDTVTDAWRDLGLPYPLPPGYSNSTDLSIVRTPFPTEFPSYRRNNQASIKSYALEFHLTLEQLRLAETLLTTEGYSGLVMVPVEADASAIPSWVRLTSNYTVKAIGLNLYALSMQVERPIACESYLAAFSCVYLPDLRQWTFPVLSADSGWGTLGDPWDDSASCP